MSADSISGLCRSSGGRILNLRPSGNEPDELPDRSIPRRCGDKAPAAAWTIRRGAFYPSLRAANAATVGSTNLSKSAYLTLMVSVWVPALKTMISSSVNVSST